MNAIERVVNLLTEHDCKPNQWTPGRWKAHCPAHRDPSPSLSVAIGDEGRVLVHCFAGCTYGDVMDALDGRQSDLFEADPNPPPASQQHEPEPLPTEAQITGWQANLRGSRPAIDNLRELRGWTRATVRWAALGLDGDRIAIPIRDKDGELLQVVRYSPAGKKPKSIVLRGRGRHLWPPPEVFSSPTVWLVEGESDALSAYELGIPAVGLPGVNGWRQEYAQRFTGRRVLVALDADGPGREAAERICAALSPFCSSRVLDLHPERDDGADLTDLLLDVIATESLPHSRGVLRRITSNA